MLTYVGPRLLHGRPLYKFTLLYFAEASTIMSLGVSVELLSIMLLSMH